MPQGNMTWHARSIYIVPLRLEVFTEPLSHIKLASNGNLVHFSPAVQLTPLLRRYFKC
jgi:hypothetical protein